MSSNKTAYPVGFPVGRNIFRNSKKYCISKFLNNVSRNRRKLSPGGDKNAINVLNPQSKKSKKLRPDNKRKLNRKKMSRLKKNILQYQKTIAKRGIKSDPIQDLKELFGNITISNVNRRKLHHDRFRSYCENMVTGELIALTQNFLTTLNAFQTRAFKANPLKGGINKRFVLGLRQVQNKVISQKVNMLIVATDCMEDNVNTEGSLSNQINSLKHQCRTQNIPVVYCLRRRELANALRVHNIVTCVGILNYSGAEELHMKLLRELEKARNLYIQQREYSECEGAPSCSVDALFQSFQKMSI